VRYVDVSAIKVSKDEKMSQTQSGARHIMHASSQAIEQATALSMQNTTHHHQYVYQYCGCQGGVEQN
jgi:hypothetical protein